MVLLSLLWISAFTWSASSGASIGDNINAHAEESPTKSLGELGWKEFNRIPGAVGKKGRTPRILFGREALVGEFPWMASIHLNNQGHSCGGSIISRRHILTAAHCLPANELSKLTVLVGIHFQNESLDLRTQRIAVMRRIKYTGFAYYSLEHDIAILVLEKEIELNDYTATINLPSGEYLYGDVNAIAAGWGRIYEGKHYQKIQEHNRGNLSTAALTPYPDHYDISPSPVLKATNLTIFNNTECDDAYDGYVNYTFKNYTICAAASRQTGDVYPGDTTKGDSGGPLFLKQSEKWAVVGITSLAHDSTKPLPGVYTRVSAYLDWIKQQMSEV